MRGLALVALAACSIPDKVDSLPDQVITPGSRDGVVFAARLSPSGGLVQQRGGGVASVIVEETPGIYRVNLQPSTFGSDLVPACTCAAPAATGVPCHVASVDRDQLIVAPLFDVDIICVGVEEGSGDGERRALTRTQDGFGATLATASISASGALSADGGWITDAVRDGTRWDITIAPVFGGAPICGCSWSGGLNDDCALDAVSAAGFTLHTLGDGSEVAAANIVCVGALPEGQDHEYVVVPAGSGTVIGSTLILSDNDFSDYSEPWIDHVSGGNGDHRVHLRPGTFGGAPRCFCSGYAADSGCVFGASAEDEIHVRTTDGNGNVAPNQIMLTCIGPRPR